MRATCVRTLILVSIMHKTLSKQSSGETESWELLAYASCNFYGNKFSTAVIIYHLKVSHKAYANSTMFEILRHVSFMRIN